MLSAFRKTGPAVCAAVLFLISVCTLFSFSSADTILPLRFYHVLTDSMEPVIPVNSLICTRPFDSSYPVKKGDILTFRATRFGETVFITHRYSHTEMNSNGDLIYRTHPQRSTIPDPYETTEEDLMGIYLFHIPYIGKFFLFLKSGFGVLWLCQISVILFIHRSLANKWS